MFGLYLLEIIAINLSCDCECCCRQRRCI